MRQVIYLHRQTPSMVGFHLLATCTSPSRHLPTCLTRLPFPASPSPLPPCPRLYPPTHYSGIPCPWLCVMLLRAGKEGVAPPLLRLGTTSWDNIFSSGTVPSPLVSGPKTRTKWDIPLHPCPIINQIYPRFGWRDSVWMEDRRDDVIPSRDCSHEIQSVLVLKV